MSVTPANSAGFFDKQQVQLDREGEHIAHFDGMIAVTDYPYGTNQFVNKPAIFVRLPDLITPKGWTISSVETDRDNHLVGAPNVLQGTDYTVAEVAGDRGDPGYTVYKIAFDGTAGKLGCFNEHLGETCLELEFDLNIDVKTQDSTLSVRDIVFVGYNKEGTPAIAASGSLSSYQVSDTHNVTGTGDNRTLSTAVEGTHLTIRAARVGLMFDSYAKLASESNVGGTGGDGYRNHKVPVPNYPAIARLVSAGVNAVRGYDPALPVMIHLDAGGDNALYRRWFDNYFANGGADFDVIGLSYYPFWHGPMSGLGANMADLAERYGKELIVVETSMGFTMENYQKYEDLASEDRKDMATKPALVEKIDYPMTPEGQRAFLRDLIALTRGNPKAAGYCWWEPCWLPIPGSQWANREGWLYVGDPGPGGNEWANQTLFDYDGNALPALEEPRRDSGRE